VDRETAEEIKRHLNVVTENLRSEIRLVAEGLEGFRDEVTRELKSVQEEIGEVKAMIRSPSASWNAVCAPSKATSPHFAPGWRDSKRARSR